MDYKILEKTDRKLIDEMPQYTSKKRPKQPSSGKGPIKKDVRLPMVQIIGPILIVVLGFAIIQLIPDKSPVNSQSQEAKTVTMQVPREKVKVAAQPDYSTTVETTPSPTPSPTPAAAEAAAAAAPPTVADPRTAGTVEPTPAENPPLVQADNSRNTIEKKAENRLPAAVAQDTGVDHISQISVVICNSVEDRRPVGEKEAFTLAIDQRVYVWMDVRSKSQPFVIKHNYYLNGQKHHEVPLTIKHPRMRTWSYFSLNQPQQVGDWRVEIVHEDQVLKQAEFRVR